MTFMPTYEPAPAVVAELGDELWEVPEPAPLELDESVSSSLQAQSAVLAMITKMQRLNSPHARLGTPPRWRSGSAAALRAATQVPKEQGYAGRQGLRREIGGWVAVGALTFADRRGANITRRKPAGHWTSVQ